MHSLLPNACLVSYLRRSSNASPPLLLIFFHDHGWLVTHNSSGALNPARALGDAADQGRIISPARALSPTPSAHTVFSAVSGLSSAFDVTTTTHFEFLLFSYLLRFVHREGRTGDFARAGLLFLFDIAFLTNEEGDGLTMAPGSDGSDPLQDARNALAEYILDGDFADVMAAGLGAAYSVLPSKVRVPSLAEQAREDPAFDSSGGMYIGTGENIDEDDPVMELPSSTDMDVRAQLDLLLKLFGFLQDILHRCQSPAHHADPGADTVSSAQVIGPAVADATLDAIQAAFIDNILYPSILECSSTDGSAVAVLTYLDVLLSNLEDGPVLQRLLDVLMDASGVVPVMSPMKKDKKRRKTGAMGFISPVAHHRPDYYFNEGRFTLRDFILDNLRSGSQTSSTASLHLLTALLGDHCQRVSPTLLTVIRDPRATALARYPLPPLGTDAWQSLLPAPVNSTDVHVQEPELYGALVPRLDDAVTGDVDTASGYASYLTDAHALLETDVCWASCRVPLQFVSDDGKPALLRVGEFDHDPLIHALSPSDPIVREVLSGLTRWFTSCPDANVALTGALAALARCPLRSLAGWLLYDPPQEDDWDRKSYASASDSDVSFDASNTHHRRRSGPPARPLPAVYQILRELVRHVGRFRATVDGFDRLLAERRQGLLFADHLEEAMSVMIEPDPATPPHSPLNTQPRKSSGLASSIKNLWSPMRKRTVSTAGSSAPASPAITSASPALATSGPGTPPRTVRALSSPISVPQTPSRSLGPPVSEVEGTSPPFRSHYVQVADTGSLEVEPVMSVQVGRWRQSRTECPQPDDGEDEEELLDCKAFDPSIPARTSLSAVLDNCIILEELIKEMVALMTARRALGIDQVGFV